MEKILQEIITWFKTAGGNVIKSLLLIYLGFMVVKFIINKIKKSKLSTKVDKSVFTFIISFTSITLKIVILLGAANILGMPTTSVVTILGSAGVAIGLALQGGLSNIVGGLTILIFKPFKVGDYIKSNSEEGTVKEITVFYTLITTYDNRNVTIPNGTLANSVIENYTANKTRRVDLEFCVAYDSNIERVKKVINEVIDHNELIIKDNKPIVRLIKHDSSSINFTTKVWTNSENYWEVYFDLQESIKEAFDKNKISIPYPQMDVHLTK